MSRNRWHILRERDRYTLARHVPARFDVEATAHFPPARMDRLAQQIRQDLWRELIAVLRSNAVENGLSGSIQIAHVISMQFQQAKLAFSKQNARLHIWRGFQRKIGNAVDR